MIHAKPSPLPCFLVNNLTVDSLEQCKFVIDNDCLEEDATIDYVYLVYCELGYELRYISIILIVFLVIVLFLALSSIADEFLCPSLLSVAKNLNMSDSLAGVTLLAFGNGCPDIFSSLAAASDDRPELIVGELLGAGIFCTSIVTGLIFIHSDFKLACRQILRDTIFYLLAVYLIWSYCWTEKITFYGALAFILIYVIYLVVALTGQAIHSRSQGEYPIAETHAGRELKKIINQDNVEYKNWFSIRDESLRRKKNGKLTDSSRSTTLSDHQSLDVHLPVSCLDSKIFSTVNKIQQRSIELNDKTNNSIMIKQQSVIKLNDNEKKSSLVEDLEFDLRGEWDQLFDHINPIDTDEWNEISSIGKVASILGAPLMFLAILTVPVVDAEKRMNNWCRPLNALHCVTVPLVISLLAKFGCNNDYLILFGIPIPLIATMLGICSAIFVYKTSNSNSPPSYHSALAYLGFIMSVLWIYTLASEIISLLKTIGIMFSMSDTAIGLGILAWGNSLGDIVANLSLARAGHARMAIGAAIGAPLLNLLLGFGISFSLNLKPGQVSPIDYSPTITLLCSTLAIILLSLMLSTLAPPNKSKKPFGYILIACYCIYFILAVCLEYNFIAFS